MTRVSVARSLSFGLTFLLIAGVAPVRSAPSNREIRNKSRDLEKVQAELEKKRQEQERLRRESENLTKEIKERQSQLRNAEDSLLNTRQRTQQVGQQVAISTIRRDNALKDVEVNRKALSSTARTYYIAYWTGAPRNPSTVAARVMIEQRAQRIRDLRGNASAVQDDLKKLMETHDVLRSEAERQESQLSDARAKTEEKNRLLSKKMSQQEEVAAELKELKDSAERLANLIDGLRTRAREEAESEKQARLQKQATGQSPIRARSLAWPVKGRVVTRFGRQKHPTLDTMFISNGIVISPAEPQPVTAVGDGKVLYAGQFMGYGSMVVVEHSGDWISVYGQLSNWSVEKGQEVKAGEPVGNTGFLAGGASQAYFELRFYGKPTDPTPWLALP